MIREERVFNFGRYTDYGGNYSGGYGGRQQSGAGNYHLGAKRKTDVGEYGVSPKKLFAGPPRYAGGPIGNDL